MRKLDAVEVVRPLGGHHVRDADEPDGSALRDAVAQPQARAAALEGEAVARDVLEATVAVELQDMERGPMRQRA